MKKKSFKKLEFKKNTLTTLSNNNLSPLRGGVQEAITVYTFCPDTGCEWGSTVCSISLCTLVVNTCNSCGNTCTCATCNQYSCLSDCTRNRLCNN